MFKVYKRDPLLVSSDFPSLDDAALHILDLEQLGIEALIPTTKEGRLIDARAVELRPEFEYKKEEVSTVNVDEAKSANRKAGWTFVNPDETDGGDTVRLLWRRKRHK